MRNSTVPKPPRGKLSAEARKWWHHFVSGWEFDEAGLLILETALQSFDRMREAQRVLEDEGLMVEDRFNQQKSHPCVQIERDSKAMMLRALKQLNLDLEPLNASVGRPSKGAYGY